MNDPALNWKSPYVFWSALGVVATILAAVLYRSSSDGGGGGGSSSSGDVSVTEIPSSQLLSEVNNVNSNAASVSEALLQSQAQIEESTIGGSLSYVTHLADARASTIQTTLNDATEQLGEVESAQTQRYASAVGASAAEYETEANVLSSMYGTRVGGLVAVATGANAANASEFASGGQASASEIGSEAQEAVGEANAATQASSAWANMFSSAFRSVGSFFSGGFTGFGSAGAAVGTEANPAVVNVPGRDELPAVTYAPISSLPKITLPSFGGLGTPTLLPSQPVYESNTLAET